MSLHMLHTDVNVSSISVYVCIICWWCYTLTLTFHASVCTFALYADVNGLFFIGIQTINRYKVASICNFY